MLVQLCQQNNYKAYPLQLLLKFIINAAASKYYFNEDCLNTHGKQQFDKALWYKVIVI